MGQTWSNHFGSNETKIPGSSSLALVTAMWQLPAVPSYSNDSNVHDLHACVVAIYEEIMRGRVPDRRSGIEKYGQDDADAFLALDEQSGEDRGWKQLSIGQKPCWLMIIIGGYTSSIPGVPSHY